MNLKQSVHHSNTITVNDKGGNPIDIGVVLIYMVDDTFRASYDVDNYTYFVTVQVEAAMRHLASMYPYDTFDEFDHESLTLRGGGEQVRKVLQDELTSLLHRAGVIVLEAYISHLSYTAQVAGAMLKRQEAVAMVSARNQIVTGAVTICESAMKRLEDKGTCELTDPQKANLVSNMLTVLVSDVQTSPIVNVGSSH